MSYNVNDRCQNAALKAEAIKICPRSCAFCCLTPQYNCTNGILFGNKPLEIKVGLEFSSNNIICGRIELQRMKKTAIYSLRCLSFVQIQIFRQ